MIQRYHVLKNINDTHREMAMHPTDQATETDPHKTHVFEAVLDAEMCGMAHLRPDMHKDNLIGLAFSGGGIRSATLNLGILQGLAKKGLLNKFDYLSTVSGGGYIGAWFSSLVKHSNHVNTVQAELVLSTQPQTLVARQLTATEQAILWLRSYSNYLTPKTGLFTGDTLAALAQWMANTLLNQVLLLCVLIVLMMSVIFFSHSEIHGSLLPAFTLDSELLKQLLENTAQTLTGKTGIVLALISLASSFYFSRRNCLSNAHALYPVLAFLCGVLGFSLLLWAIPQSSWQQLLTSHVGESEAS
jgi:hypothetical protein